MQKGVRYICRTDEKVPTTRACIFATIHKEATILLMDLMEESGLSTMVER